MHIPLSKPIGKKNLEPYNQHKVAMRFSEPEIFLNLTAFKVHFREKRCLVSIESC